MASGFEQMQLHRNAWRMRGLVHRHAVADIDGAIVHGLGQEHRRHVLADVLFDRIGLLRVALAGQFRFDRVWSSGARIETTG